MKGEVPFFKLEQPAKVLNLSDKSFFDVLYSGIVFAVKTGPNDVLSQGTEKNVLYSRYQRKPFSIRHD